MSTEPEKKQKPHNKEQQDDHHDEANPMPDTHHVNPKGDKSSGKTSGNAKQ